MPNIKPSLGYVHRMRLMEAKYISGVNEARRNFRRSALEILTFYGAKMASIQDVRREIATLEQRVNAIGKENSAVIDEIVLWYLNQQLGNLRKAGETRLPTVQQLNLSTYQQRQEAYQNTLETTPAWVNDLAKNMETNITRLSMANADLRTAADRLLSTAIADGRASVYRLSGAAATLQTKDLSWTAAGIVIGNMFTSVHEQTGGEYKKQAIAAIDQNTTDCCLRVHGQIQPLNKPFILEGTPRFTDKLDSPPFHWNCRTAQTLYMERMENIGISTNDMRDAAKAERKAREDKSKNVTWPVSSTSRR